MTEFDWELISLIPSTSKNSAKEDYALMIAAIEAYKATLTQTSDTKTDGFEHIEGQQMNLGDLIGYLKSLPADTPVPHIHNPHSYRGYYSDLAFEFKPGGTSAENMLEWLARYVLDQTFTGYKGGEYKMMEDAPLWSATCGCTGRPIMGIKGTELILGDA